MRARGVRPRSLPTCSLPIATSAAPSTMPEELPAWWTWSIFSTQWYFSSATESKPRSPWNGERRLELRQALDGGAGPDELVLLEHGQAVDVLDRDRPSRRSSRWPAPWRRGPATRRRTRRRPRATSPRWWRSGRRRCPAGRTRCRTPWSGRWPTRRRRSPSAPGSSTRRRRRGSGPPSRSGSAAGGLVDGLEAGGAEAVELHARRWSRGSRPRAPRSSRCRRPGRRSGRRTPSTTSSTRSMSKPSLRLRTSSRSVTTRSTGFTSCREPSFLPLPRGVRIASYTMLGSQPWSPNFRRDVPRPERQRLPMSTDCDTLLSR